MMARDIVENIGLDASGKEELQKTGFANRIIVKRTLILMIVFGIVAFIPLVYTLYNLMINDHTFYEEMAVKNQTRYTTTDAFRGEILDRNGDTLAASIVVENVFIDPKAIAEEMEQPLNSNLLDRIASGLSRILNIDAQIIYDNAKETEYRYRVVARKISEEKADEVRDFVEEGGIIGVYLEPDELRCYPMRSMASQVLGFLSMDNVGAEGLEAKYDSYLQGTSGKTVSTKGNKGSEMLYAYEKVYDAENGYSLVLTLDSTVQTLLESNLEKAIEKYDIQRGAFGIVMDADTGEILAMASAGGFDPNCYAEIYNDDTAKALEEEYQAAQKLPENSPERTSAMNAYNENVAAERLRQWRNRCVSDGYEPGSTFKLITLAAALDSGAVTLDSDFYCAGEEEFEYRDQVLECWKHEGHGQETLAQALQNSCNLAFAHIGLRLGRNQFYTCFDSFGFLDQTGVDLPGEASGFFYSKDDFSISNLISASFGQSFKVTPIQLVRAVSAIVNGGYLMEPYIVSEVLDDAGNILEKHSPTVIRQVISEETSATMRMLMESVVTEGTASSAYTPGYRVGGKTGTSEKLDEYDEYGNPSEDKIVSFVGVAPADRPRYVVLVALDSPKHLDDSNYTPDDQYISGGLMAAPTVRDVFIDILPYLSVEPDYSTDDIRGISISVPSLISMSKSEAVELLTERKLTYRTVGTGSTVTDQRPSAGYEVPGNSEIVLYMGTEKTMETVEVPDFIGYSVTDVRWLADKAELYVQAKGTDRTGLFVTAAYQDIEPGTMVEKGTTVSVEFSSGGASD